MLLLLLELHCCWMCKTKRTRCDLQENLTNLELQWNFYYIKQVFSASYLPILEEALVSQSWLDKSGAEPRGAHASPALSEKCSRPLICALRSRSKKCFRSFKRYRQPTTHSIRYFVPSSLVFEILAPPLIRLGAFLGHVNSFRFSPNQRGLKQWPQSNISSKEWIKSHMWACFNRPNLDGPEKKKSEPPWK